MIQNIWLNKIQYCTKTGNRKNSIRSCSKDIDLAENICLHHFCCNTCDTSWQLAMFSWIKKVNHGGFCPNYHLSSTDHVEAVWYWNTGSNQNYCLKLHMNSNGKTSYFCYPQCRQEILQSFCIISSWVLNHGDLNAQTLPTLNISTSQINIIQYWTHQRFSVGSKLHWFYSKSTQFNQNW